MRIQLQQEEQIRMQQQQEEEQLRIQQQAEQMRIQQQQEEQLRIQMQQEEERRYKEEQLRIQQQEEQLRIQKQQEEQMRIQQQQEEQARIQRQQEEQMRIQQQQEEQRRIQLQQEEQRRIQQQQEEQMRIQREQEEQARQAAEMKRQQEEAERQRQEQIQRQEMERQQQEMMLQQQSQSVISSQISSSSSTTRSGVSEAELEDQKRREYEEWFKTQEKEALEYSACVKYQEKASETQNVITTVTESTEQQSFSQQQQSAKTTIHNSSMPGFNQGFAAESRPEPLLSESQLAKPPMSSSLSLESSQSQSFAQQSSHIQQSSSSSFQSKTTQEVYESQEFSGGVMKGYRMKQEQNADQRETGEKMLNTGVFGGIGGDNNSLVDAEFDYKKHSVKDLAKHFALVKPKADIPHTILPEQRIYNGDQGPALNYLGSAKGEMGSTSSTHSFTKKEVSQEDFEASKLAYENKKKQQQMESQKSQSTVSSQSTVVKRSETEQNRTVVNERRQSLTSSLMLDPATAHAESGIIDPSAILRGSDGAGIRSRSEGILGNSTEPGETDKILNKWDNHNAIARGWGGVKENYHPVTFRGIYNVDSQTQNL